MSFDTTRPHTEVTEPVALRFLQGVAMGSADIVPGVSGGTVALILGIYTTLVGAIRTVATAGTALLRGRTDEAAANWHDTPWRFLLSLGMGIVTALGIGSVVLPPLLEHYPAQTSAVFFGMIVASLAVPWRQAGDHGPRLIAVMVVCALVAFVVMGLPAVVVEGDLPPWRVFASAAVAICAMILPGVSGAFLLVASGAYEPTLEAASGLDISYLAVFVAGAVVGLGTFSKLLSHLLDHHLAVTMAGLTGLMAGALRVLWPWGGHEGRLDGPPDAVSAVVALCLALAGFAVVRGLLAFGDRATRRDLSEAV